MTRGGTSPRDFGYNEVDGTPSPAPLAKPPLTLKEIRDSIPPHCFSRSLFKSMLYLVTDIVKCVSCFYASTYIVYCSTSVQFVLWPLYWYLQGMLLGGPWVLAHECSHGAFSDYGWINDCVGWCVHSALLVPYFGFKESHRKHHSNAGSCDEDEYFVPPTRSKVSSRLVEMIQDSPIYNVGSLLLLLTVGWFPTYLVYNISGPAKYNGKNASHFSPSSEMFRPKQWREIMLSNLGFSLVLSLPLYASVVYGVKAVTFHYGIPYMILSAHFMLITYLHHTDTYIPHYRGKEWTWLRGALTTVDRSYGLFMDHTGHEIASTHVLHHLFPTIPFYNAKEATKAMSKVLGSYHLRDDTPIWTAVMRANRHCQFVEDSGDIVFYKKNVNVSRVSG